MSLSRRTLLKGAAASGALLLVGGPGALARPLGPEGFATTRGSQLFPASGTRLVHADLHNHSHLSDGAGDPALAFDSMRAAGLDVAALTDHATLSWGPAGSPCGPIDGESTHGQRDDCSSVLGLDEAAWAYTAALADGADDPGEFAALRGFEWTSPFLGHVNVWFSRTWIDPLHTAGIGPEGIGQHLHAVPELGPIAGGVADTALRANPLRTSMEAFYSWLDAEPDTPGIGGGADGLAGFNHPGREPGRFAYFSYAPQLRDRIVSLELFNRRDDYLFEGYDEGQPSPLVECLNAGWRVGLLGVSDEHGTEWGFDAGKGRGGLWVASLDRDGVREALAARRFFATNQPGLRLDVAAASGPHRAQMGQPMPHTAGPVSFEIDLDLGPQRSGDPIDIQVLRPGEAFPEVVHVESVRAPVPGAGPATLTVDLDVDDGDWVVLRIADPTASNNQQGPAGHPCNALGLAYASPFWLVP